ncbi:hypothetical protein GCM10022384_55880 [Streptomyces marokkonensis]|uniref:Uncharacterized protein n=1 Tax=Streptomyces marokkonensis TaxID=324855 RepID=A0ABP7RTB8_9ACTN
MARPGYGKRPAGDEDPYADPDFAHLLPREAEVAVFIDHLDTGHVMGHKVLAAQHPRYGRQAMRTSLSRITGAGHLHWISRLTARRRFRLRIRLPVPRPAGGGVAVARGDASGDHPRGDRRPPPRP